MTAAGTEHHRVLQCIARKQAIIADLISGRLSLLEATARFQQAGEVSPGSYPVTEPMGEDWCRTVIGWAHLALCDRPERAAAVLDSLERQLETHLARYGSVRLPS